MYTNISVLQFQQEFFPRDFPYGTDINTSVLDSDISKAFTYTNMNINQTLFPDQGSYNLGYALLSAHYLVTNLSASSQGKNGQYAFLEQSKGVGGINQAFAIPQRILDNPYWSMLSKTEYGAEYISLLLPQLSGQMFSVFGGSGAGYGGQFFPPFAQDPFVV